MICDMIIITSSYFVLKDWEKVVYGFVTLYVSSFVLDQIVNSARQSVQFFIISKKYQEIGREINALHRGVTVIDATGLYTGQEQKICLFWPRNASRLLFSVLLMISTRVHLFHRAQLLGLWRRIRPF